MPLDTSFHVIAIIISLGIYRYLVADKKRHVPIFQLIKNHCFQINYGVDKLKQQVLRSFDRVPESRQGRVQDFLISKGGVCVQDPLKGRAVWKKRTWWDFS